MSGVLASGPELNGLAAIVVLLAAGLGLTIVLGLLAWVGIYLLERLQR